MLNEQWIGLLQKQSVFPLEATLKLEHGGPERYSFRVDRIEGKKSRATRCSNRRKIIKKSTRCSFDVAAKDFYPLTKQPEFRLPLTRRISAQQHHSRATRKVDRTVPYPMLTRIGNAALVQGGGKSARTNGLAVDEVNKLPAPIDPPDPRPIAIVVQ